MRAFEQRERPIRMIVIIASAFFLSCGGDPGHKVRSAASSITVAELRDHLYFLASDALTGRMPGEKGYDVAADYAASQFRQAGLVPVCSGADGRAAYLQELRIIKKRVGKIGELSLKTSAGAKALRYGPEFFVISPGNRDTISLSGSLVFAGYGIHEPRYDWDDYAGIDVKGKWVVYMFGSPLKDGKPVLPKELTEAYASGVEGYYKKAVTAREAGAVGVVVIFDKERFQAWDILRHARSSYCMLPNHDPLFFSPCVEVCLNREPLGQLFAGRSYNPITGEGEYGAFPMADATLSLEAEIAAEEIHSANVVGLVKGTDPTVGNEYISVGAHLDHIGQENGEVFNGADDNASGSVAVLEAAEAVALNPPKRSVIFILYTGEEMKFMGSQYFVLNSPVPLEHIAVNINLDMVGRPDGEAQDLAVNVGGNQASEIKSMIDSVNSRQTHLLLDYGYDRYFKMSDQVAFYLAGIPVVFLISGDHEDVHKATDDAGKIDYEFLRDASRLAYFLAMELADREEGR
jgi:hypothetical protein